MPSEKWHFRTFQPGDNLSDPDFTKALFASDSDAAVARSLIREGIQNSLDARAGDAARVRVRISLRTGVHAASPEAANPFIAGLQRHVDARDSGLSERPPFDQPINHLVVEDFGTKGLAGDPEHWRPTGIGRNAFFLFFRALGRSGKENEARGRWGVGKFVFPMSSQAHTIWGLTIREEDPQPLLMGRAVLRTHETGSEQWHPDGHWGIRSSPGSNLVSPSRDTALIQEFRRVFGVSRTTEPGLSIVVPWASDEINLAQIRRAVLEEYFLPLLRNELIVELHDGDSVEVLTGDAVRALAETAEPRRLKELLALAVGIVDQTGIAFEWPVQLTWQSLEILPGDLPAALRETLAETLDQGRTVSVTFPVTVARKDSATPHSGRLVVHMRRADGLGAARPLLVRDGIAISEDKTRSLQDHAAILLAERCALATAIGDAETPAHEQMQHELLKDRYKYPRKLVSFVRDSAALLLRAIRSGDTADDPLALASFFPVDAASGPERPAPAPEGSDDVPSTPTPDIPPGASPRYRLTRIRGGFKVSGRPSNAPAITQLAVRAAYDVRRGDPFKRYRPFDFDLRSTDMTVEIRGATIAVREADAIVLTPDADDFELTVTGFDEARDVVVRVRVEGADA